MEKTKTQVMLAVIALTSIEHDGVKYGPGQEAGDSFELTEAQSVPLLAVNAIELAVPAEMAAADDGTQQDGDKTVVPIKGKAKGK